MSGQVYGGYGFLDDVSTGCAFTADHGTGIAGIIGAADDGGGVLGMAPAAHLYSYLVVASNGAVSDAALADAFEFAIADSVRVINLSLANCGQDASGIVADAIADAVADSVIVVAAAGNGAYNCGPGGDGDAVSGFARLPGVIGVSEFDTTLVRTTHGQYGPAVVLSGPEQVDTDSLGSGYPILHLFTGTSAATPHVTGAFALALAAGFNHIGAITQLETYTRLGPGQTGKDNYYGYGELDAAAILPRPTLNSVTWCTNGNITSDDQLDGGYCLFVAHTSYGAPPIQAQFKVITSVLHDTTIYAWGSTSREIAIPPTIGGAPADTAGYTMTVYTYIRDSPFQRAATDTLYKSFYVCNIGSDFIRGSPNPSTPSRGVHPDLPEGCTS